MKSDTGHIQESTHPPSRQDNDLFQLHSTLDVLPTFIYVQDEHSRIVSANAAFCDALGVDRDDLIGRTVGEVLGEHAPLSSQVDLEVMESGTPRLGVIEHYPAADGTRCVLTDRAPIIDENGTVIGLVGMSMDITAQKQKEHDLAIRDRLLDLATDCIIVHSLDGKILYANAATATSRGYEREELAGMTMADIETPDQARLWEERARMLMTAGHATFESITPHKDGTLSHMEIRATVVTLDERPIVVSVARDISERVESEQALRQSEHQLRFLTDNVADIFWTMDLELRTKYISPSIERVLGFTVDEYKEKRFEEIVTPESAERVFITLKQQLAFEATGTVDPNRTYSISAEYYHKNGSTVWLEQVVKGIRGPDGALTGLIGVARDSSERVKSEQALRHSEQQLRLLTDNVADMFWTMDLNFKTTYVSPSVERVLGFSPEERAQQELQDMVTPESTVVVLNVLQQELQREAQGDTDPDRTVTTEVEYYRKDGSTMWTESIVKGLREANGTLVGMVGVARDITERRRIEEQLRLRGTLLDNANDAIYLVDEVGRILYANEAACTMTGFSTNSLLAMTMRDLNAHSFADQVPARISTMLKRGEFSFETRHRRRDGSEVDVAVRTRTFEADGGRFFASVARDVTETRRIEKELRASEEKYRSMVTSINDVVYTLDADGVVTFISPQAEAFSGIRTEDIVGKRFSDFVHPDDLPCLLQSYERLVQGIMEPSDFRILDVEGGVRHVRSSSRPHFEDGRFSGAICTLVEMTARVEAEQALQESERKYRELFEQSVDAICLVSTDGRFLDVNAAWFQLLGYSRKDLEWLRATDVYLVPEHRDVFIKTMEGKKELIDDEVFFRKKDGTPLCVRRSVRLRYAADGSILGYQSVVKDVTLARETEEALRESEARYRELFEQSVDAVSLATEEGRVIEANFAWHKLFGYTPEDLEWFNTRDSYAQPDGREKFLDRISRTDEVQDEVKFKRKDGTVFDCLRSVKVRRAPDGSIIGYHTVFHDITEQKQAQRQRSESARRFRTLFNLSRDATYLMTPDGTLAEVNQAWLNLFGYTRDEIAQLNVYNLFADGRGPAAIISESLKKRGVATGLELRLLKSDGTIMDCICDLVVHLDENAHLMAIQGATRDVTEQKRAERALRESEARFRTLSENLDDTVARVDRNCRLLYINPAIDRLSGQSHQDYVGRSLSDISGFLPATLDVTRDAIMRVFATGRPLSGSMTIETQMGQRAIDWHMAPERDEDGEIQTVLLNLHDITDLRHTQEELNLAGERLRKLASHLQDAREHERTSLARDLHDNIGQGLTALTFDLLTLKRSLQRELNQKDAAARMDNVIAMVDGLALDVRHLSTELRPGMLDDLGLCAAMEWQVGSFVERTGIQCELSLPENDAQIPPTTAIVLYRVLQELLTNIARHSKATSARASLFMSDNFVTLEMTDNGVGVNSRDIASNQSFGILGIRERVRPLGGEFTISGKRHKGTTATVRVPLNEPSQEAPYTE